ncbi:hypothetical protein LTS18_013585 [Coniosporium uncinatum]|uniref:Uncharacterized protein n=1 Tax=Coniosporium uncinatum TaxID=93489 RepID=A0ACC3D9A5_9PEZI|nr:hypothetical protein LTS18_013585 [Coniosporium uncinatum]
MAVTEWFQSSLTLNKVCTIQDPVTTHVGKTHGNEQRYAVSEEVSCKQSDYFVKAFRGPFREGTEKSIHFDDEEPEISEIFLRWLCTGSAFVLNPASPSRSLAYHAGDGLRMIKSWIFGDEHELECFQKHLIVCEMQLLVCMDLNDVDIRFAYENTVSNAPLRMLVAFNVAEQLCNGSCS